jgi:hypothetical protein
LLHVQLADHGTDVRISFDQPGGQRITAQQITPEQGQADPFCRQCARNFGTYAARGSGNKRYAPFESELH